MTLDTSRLCAWRTLHTGGMKQRYKRLHWSSPSMHLFSLLLLLLVIVLQGFSLSPFTTAGLYPLRVVFARAGTQNSLLNSGASTCAYTARGQVDVRAAAGENFRCQVHRRFPENRFSVLPRWCSSFVFEVGLEGSLQRRHVSCTPFYLSDSTTIIRQSLKCVIK